MEMYKKPVMNIIEMEKVDVLTASGTCSCGAHFGDWSTHYSQVHNDTGAFTPDQIDGD